LIGFVAGAPYRVEAEARAHVALGDRGARRQFERRVERGGGVGAEAGGELERGRVELGAALERVQAHLPSRKEQPKPEEEKAQ
jgi:hypothetical protein